MIFGNSARVRPIQQMEAAECGVACLAMVLDYHGCSSTLAEVREVCKTSRDGNSVLDLIAGATTFGLDGEGFALGIEELGELRLPAILHWDFNHFVVLESVRGKRARIVDPASGRRIVDERELDRSFSGVALELNPTPALPKRKRRSPAYGRYVEAVSNLRAPLVFVLLASSAQQLFAIVLPAASQVLIDHVIQPARTEWFVPVFAVMAVSALAQIVLARVHGLALSAVQASLSTRLSSQFVRHLFRLPIPFLESRSHGDLLARVRSQAELRGLLTGTVQAAFDLVLVLLLALLMLVYDAFLGGLALGLTALRALIVRALQGASAQRTGAELAACGREQATLAEAAQSPEMNQAFGLEARLAARFGVRSVERANWSMSSERLQQGLGQALSILGGAMQGVILWFGGRQVIAGELSVGVFAGFMAIRSMLETPLESLIHLADGWIRFRSALARCDDVLSVEPVARGRVAVPERLGRIEVEGLGFRYGSGGEWVLRDVSFSIAPGEHVVLLGPSGHGKSTLSKLLAGVLQPTEGRVSIDGVEIQHYEPLALARRLAVCLQEALILDGTVLENLALRLPEASFEQAMKAARLACFDDVVTRMPDGYATRVAARGRDLSGGERQRFALAQALLGDPDILIMDESTSALDAATEARVLENLASLQATRISVAHRESVARCADRALLVRDGSVTPLGATSFQREEGGAA